MLSKVDSEGPHYKVLTEVADHKRDDSNITKVDCFIKYSNGKLHWKSNTRGRKLLVDVLLFLFEQNRHSLGFVPQTYFSFLPFY